MSEAKCPVAHGANSNMEKSSTDWWPKNLNLDILHQHDQKTKPFNGSYNSYFLFVDKIFAFFIIRSD